MNKAPAADRICRLLRRAQDELVVAVKVRETTGSMPGGIGLVALESLTPTIKAGQLVTISYADPAGDDTNAIQDAAGNDVASFTTGEAGVPAVDNNSTQTVAGIPGAPTGLSATAVSGARIALSWAAPTNTGSTPLTGYKIEWSPDGTSGWKILVANTGSTATAYTTDNKTSPEHGDTRHYRVSALNTAGSGPDSTSDSATADGTPPVVNTTSGSVVVESSGARLEIYFDEHVDHTRLPPSSAFTVTADGVEVAIGSIFASTFPLPGGIGLVALESLTPTIKAGQLVTISYADPAGDDTNAIQDAAGNDVASFTTGEAGVPAVDNNSTQPTTVPGQISVIEATGAGNTVIRLSWSPPANTGGQPITAYKIEASEDVSPLVFEVIEAKHATMKEGAIVTAYEHTGRPQATTWHYRISAINSVGTGAVSAVVNATTLTGQPSAPRDLEATAQGGTRIELAWRVPERVGDSAITGYLIQVSEDEGETFTELVASHDRTTYSHTGLDSETTHHYRVAAINEDGTGPFSDVAFATTDDIVAPKVLADRIDVGSDGATLDIGFDEPLDDANPPSTSDFTVTAGGVEVTIGSIAISEIGGNGLVRLLGLTPTVKEDQTVRVSYADPGTGDDPNAVQDDAGNDAAGFDLPASNNSAVDPVVPGAPTGLEARGAGNDSIVLSWSPPAYNGGAAITAYRIEVSADVSPLAFEPLEPDHNEMENGRIVTSYTHTGLSLSDVRHYRVSAKNSAGAGPPSNVARGQALDPKGTVDISVSPGSVAEDGTVTWTVTATTAENERPGNGFTMRVEVASENGTATAPDDFAAVAETLTFEARHFGRRTVDGNQRYVAEMTRSFTLADDARIEGEERFALAASVVGFESRYVIGTGRAEVAIADNDDWGIEMTADRATVAEGETAEVVLTATVVPSGRGCVIDFPVTVALAVEGTASNPADYTLDPAPGQMDLEACQESAVWTVTLAALTDLVEDNNETIEVRLTFSEAVTVAGGTPSLGVTGVTAGTDPAGADAVRELAYASGSGSATLSFAASVSDADTLSKLAVIPDTLGLNGASLVSAASGLAAETDHDGTAPTAAPAAAPPVGVVSAAVTSDAGANGTWDAGEEVVAALRFSDTVTVTGTPVLAVRLGAAGRAAAYAGGSGTDTLTFRLAVAAADAGTRRARLVGDGLVLGSATITDGAGRAVDTRFAVAPYVIGVALAADASGDGSWTPGEAIEVRLAFSEPVTVADAAPNLGVTAVAAGTEPSGTNTARRIDYASGSGSAMLLFRDALTDTDGTLERIAVTADSLALAGARIVSRATGLAAETGHDGTAAPVALAAPRIAGVAQVGNTLAAAFAEAPDGTVTYRWLRGAAEIADATAGTYAPVAADVGQALSVRVESGGASATSAPSAPVWPAPANPALAAGEEELLSAVLTLGSWDGFPARIAGYSRALDTSFGEMDETAFEDGGTRHAVDFLVVNENGEFALATGATLPEAAGLAAYWNGHRIAQFEARTLEEGLRILVGRTPQSEAAYMRYMDGASDGVRVAVSLRRVRAAQVEATPDDGAPGDLTASFLTAPPDEHDGTSPFTFRIAFSENLDGYSYKTLRDSSLTVMQGAVRLVPTKVKRVYPNDPARANTAWNVEVTPQSKEDISIELGPGPACDAAGAMCTGDGKALSNSISSTVLGPPALSVADATVQEADGAAMEFAVTMSRASVSTVTVDYATSDGTAKAGEDYRAVSDTLTFAPGETAKTVSVPVLNDGHDDDGETFALTLSNASGGNAYIADATATGTIENTGPMPQAWLSRFGRTVAEQVIEAVEGRLWGQLFQAAMLFAAFMTVAVPAWNLWRSTSGAEWYAASMVTLAELKLTLGYEPDSGQEVRFADGTRHVLRIRDVAASVPALEARERIKAEMFASAGLGAAAGGGLIALFLVVFWYRGAKLGRQKRIRGAEMVTAAELRRRLQSPHARLLTRLPGGRRLRPYSIAGIPYPERTETQHTIVSGTTGSGKTVLISDLVSQIRSRGERCVIYDKMGSYTRSFFDPARDVLMNPLDARAPRWSPFFEARDPRDFDMMAAALIPQQKDTVDPFWVTAARQLFSNGAGVFWKQGVQDNKVLVDHLLKTELTALAEAMAGTVAQSIVDPENPKTALSVRAMLTANLSALELLPDEGKPFSIRDWISDEARDRNGGGFLFLTSRGDQHASLRGLISTWLEIAVNAMLSLAQGPDRRIWVILDELPTLHQVPSLQPGLAESRQFGGCFVLGVQVASALRDLYGRNGAETISGLCGTRVVLAAPDRDTAQWSADSLGRSEVEEVAEGYSYGANTIRDGVSLTPRRELRALALPSEIMRLANLEGYLKFPGPFPVASIKLKYVARPAAAERFVPRKGDGSEPYEASAARPGEEEIGIPEPAGADEAGCTHEPAGPDLPSEPASWQGELDLVPLPGEAGDPHSEAALAETADGEAPEGKGKSQASGNAALAQAPQDGAPGADTESETPPHSSGAGDGRGSEWL